jgi:hypothetical protein
LGAHFGAVTDGERVDVAKPLSAAEASEREMRKKIANFIVDFILVRW